MSHLEDTLIVRKAEYADIRVIRTLAHAIWPGTYGEILPEGQMDYMLKIFYTDEAIKKQMKEGHEFLIVEVNAEAVGFASYSHSDRAGVYTVHKLYVLEAVQGKGIGTHLLNDILERIRPAHPKELQLYVYRLNPAKEFYEKKGFKVLKEVEEPIGEGYFVRDYVMVKQLR